ncbi:MAG: hypothetical protein L0Z54_03960 [Thermoplasmata archaeon]|nr:hypothetical protein [Thermoplasmata archaeon]
MNMMKWTLLAISIVTMALFVGATSAKTVLNDEPLDDVRLFFQSDTNAGEYNLTTHGPGAGDGGTIGVSSGETATRDYQLNKTLQYDLEAIGKDLGGPRGFHARIVLSCSGVGGTTEAKVGVLELRGTNETLVGESAWETAQTDWDIPFVETEWTSYTFRAGSLIIFRISVTTDAFLGGSCSVDNAGDYFLNLTASPVKNRVVLSIWDHTEVENQTEEFYPNLPPDIRFMNITGNIENAFGSYDISNVTIDIDRIGGSPGSILDDQVARHANNYKTDEQYKYHYQWWWNPKDITASDPTSGSDGYNIVITFMNDFGHKFRMTNLTWHFDMLEYGVMLRFWDSSEEVWLRTVESTGEVNASVDVEFYVFNTGLTEETVMLEAINPKPGENWTVELDDDEFILAAGEDTVITASVGIPNIDPGKWVNIELDAIVDEDPDASDAVFFKMIALGVIDFDFYLTDGNYSRRVGRSETATFPFTLKNTGNDELDFDYTSQPETAPNGWTIQFVDEPPIEAVDAGETVTFQFRVTAPSDDTGVDKNPKFEISAWPVGHMDIEQYHNIEVILDTYTLIEEISSMEETCTVEDTTPHFVYREADFTLTLYNGESEEEDCEVSIDYDQSEIDLADWDVTFNPSGGTVTIGSEQKADVAVELTPEDDFAPGEYDVFIKASIPGKKTETQVVKVIVEEYVDASFELTSSDNFKDVEEGDNVQIVFTLENNGNLEDGFLVIVSGIDSKWDVKINDVTGTQRTILVESLGSSTVSIDLVPPEEAQGDDVTVTVHVESTSDSGVSEDFSVRISVEEEPTDPTDVMSDMAPLIVIVIVFAGFYAFYRKKTAKKVE